MTGMAIMPRPNGRYDLYSVAERGPPTKIPWTSHLWWTRFLLVVRDRTVSTAWEHKGSFAAMEVALRWWIENLTLPQKVDFCQNPVPHDVSRQLRLSRHPRERQVGRYLLMMIRLDHPVTEGTR